MRWRQTVGLGLGCLAAVVLSNGSARADDGTTPRGVVPLGAPPAPRQVPIPDVRGLGEAAALRALAESGLRVGGIERVSVARLQAELGRTYAIGLVVQQAPRPSTGSQPSWLARGAPVWLRVASARDEGVVHPARQPARPRQPVRPRLPVRPRQPVQPRVPYVPPYAGPVPQPTVARPPVTRPPVAQPPIAQPRAVPPSISQPPPFRDTTISPTSDLGPAGPLRKRLALRCERRLASWHLRPVGGGVFPQGDDKGDTGYLAGVDLGRTFSNCFGVDFFYRYVDTSFDRDVPGGLLQDAGQIHTAGLKLTFNKSLGSNSRMFFWAGLGAGYFTTSGLQHDDEGVAGYGELGLGYLLSDALRIRLGGNVIAMDTDAGRRAAANDRSKRLLWLAAPTLSLELDM